MIDPHGVGNFAVRNADHPGCALSDDGQCVGQGLTAGQAVSEGVGCLGAYHTALLNALGEGIGMPGHDAHDLGLEAQQVAGAD